MRWSRQISDWSSSSVCSSWLANCWCQTCSGSRRYLSRRTAMGADGRRRGMGTPFDYIELRSEESDTPKVFHIVMVVASEDIPCFFSGACTREAPNGYIVFV